jgi:uncharacterized protein
VDFALIAFGLGVGVLVGMTGIGGGSLMTPMLILVFGVTPVTAIGTDLAYAAVTKTVGGYKHWRQRTVDVRLSTWMALGSVPGVWLGSHWSVRVEPAVLRTTLAIVLIGAGLALLIKAGLDLPVMVLVPFPAAVIVLLVWTIVREQRARAERLLAERPGVEGSTVP